ncbi:MAG: acetylesterase [Haloplasmataceae bacterium]|jgi:acetyl esterase/lipase|nr:acetylesterase [Haloplasmataceae bacterium]
MINNLINFNEEAKPSLTSYILEGSKYRGAVVILPGGGYHRTTPREAEPIAIKFNEAGFHAFVLHYRVAPNRYPKALVDVSQTMRLI